MSRLELAIQQIEFARKYSASLVESVPPVDWFRQPTEGVTHLAWQVGHLAMAQYRLLLHRIRGQREGDEALIASDFIERFRAGSTPEPDPAKNPSPAEIRDVFDRVHRQAMAELPMLSEAALDEPSVVAHRLFETKFGALMWCANHEMVHAGQIGLLRRLLGEKPRW